LENKKAGVAGHTEKCPATPAYHVIGLPGTAGSPYNLPSDLVDEAAWRFLTALIYPFF
jgi:hypothetical protein